MSDRSNYGGVAFAPDFTTAQREDGSTVKFTRNERRLLLEFTRRAGQLCTRNQLLDAIDEPGSDASDRNVDFAINRLRAKLGCVARDPRFIETRYGEGYVWIAARQGAHDEVRDAFVVVGPVRGMAAPGARAQTMLALAQALRAALEGRLATGAKVAFDPQYHAPVGDGAAGPRFGVELAFVSADGAIACVVALKCLRTDRLLMVDRRTQRQMSNAEALAEDIAAALWSAFAPVEDDPAPTAEPLALRIHGAAEPFRREGENWVANDARLRRVLAANPDDPVARLMLATNIHNKYIMRGWRHFLSGDPRRGDEDEMERLLIGALPALQQNPHHALSAAKLLMFLDRGWRRTAVDMAQAAFGRATAMGQALTTMGQMRVFLGDFDAGVGLLEQARALSKPGSEFDLYVLVMLCQAHMAAGDATRLRRTFDTLCRRRSLARGPLGLVLAPPVAGTPSLSMRVTLRLMTARHARALLTWSHYVSARQFSDAEHRRNAILGLATLLRGRFGDQIVPDEVAASLLDTAPPFPEATAQNRTAPLNQTRVRS